ncbi:hypothetical protein [Celeribacter sp. SCSIO 80788]|uniref:hypothetical protein n=1 Tax=Celeribacter sp. SCSIO 80788 TaxID=3117013 RepID=UPI003DA65300
MTAKLILHLPEHEQALLEAGKMSTLYPRIKRMVERRGGVVEIAPRFPPTEPDGNLHIVDNARQPHPDTLISVLAYLDRCWHLDPKGVLADSSIADRVFDPEAVDAAQAEAYVGDLRARFSDPRQSRYHQKKQMEEIDPEGIVIFLQGPPPYRRGHAYMGRDKMIRAVLDGAGGRPVYIKPHPLRKDEGLKVIRAFEAEGYAPIKTNANVHDLLRQAAVTVSANSAASIEGFLHGTPTILFARADFDQAAEVVKAPEDFPAALEWAVGRPRDYTQFLYWYFSQCLWLDDPFFETRVLERFTEVGFPSERLGLTNS